MLAPDRGPQRRVLVVGVEDRGPQRRVLVVGVEDKRSAVLGNANKMEPKPRRGVRNGSTDSKGDRQRFRPFRYLLMNKTGPS